MGPIGNEAAGGAGLGAGLGDRFVDFGATALLAGFVSESRPPVGSSLSWSRAQIKLPSASTKISKSETIELRTDLALRYMAETLRAYV